MHLNILRRITTVKFMIMQVLHKCNTSYIQRGLNLAGKGVEVYLFQYFD